MALETRLQVGRPAGENPSPVERLRSAREAGVTKLHAGSRFTMLGLLCDVPESEAEVEVRLRTSLDGRRWSAWYAAPLEVSGEDGAVPRAYTDALWTGEGRFVQVCAAAVGDDAPLALTGVELVTLDTAGGLGAVASATAALRRIVATVAGVGQAAPAQAAVEAPHWITRAGWGADESLRSGDPVTAPVKMVFIHHTAGSNTYTRDQALSMVRGIYVYHTTGLGWSDIGYNFLIDRFGTIYVGRAGGPRQGVVGAHVYGFNTGSTGVSVMGTYTDQAPSAAALDALGRLLAWKLELHGLDPFGSAEMTCGGTEKYTAGQTVTLPVVSGHRDANYTACPGDALYAQLSALRGAATSQIRFAAVEAAPYALTLSLSQSKIRRGARVTFKGTVKTSKGVAASGTVTLQKRRAPDGAWLAWRTAKLSSTGSWSLAVKMTSAPRDWQLRARMPGAGANLTGVSAIRGLKVTAPAAPYALTLSLSQSKVRRGARVTFKGTVKTSKGVAASGTVTLQKRRAPDGAWLAWRTAKLSSTGSWSLAVKMTSAPRDWQLRARMPGAGANLTGVSAIRGLKVTVPAVVTQETAFSVSGRGWGHGIGLSQWGARGFALQGLTYREILKYYYTGIGFSDVGTPTLRVLLKSGLSTVRLTCPEAFTVRGAADAATIPAGATVTTTYVDGKCRVAAGSWSREFGATVTFAPTASPLTVLTATDAGISGAHRGTIRVIASGGALMMINDVGMQSYLRGVVAHEMPASWPTEALKAQACAARAYAERARRRASGSFDLYCDTRSQVYGGAGREDARTDAAVVDTIGVVPSVGGEPIQAFYFSCSGGQTENVELAWQTGALPYLKAVNDPYDDAAPRHTWGPLSRTGAQLEAALGSNVKGSLLAVCPVERGVSPRIVKAAIVGSEGTTYLHGSLLRTKLSLNSAWATFTSLSIAPAASDGVILAAGGSVTLRGRIYPALAAGAAVTLRSECDGLWRGQTVTTTRHAQQLPGGYTAAYSSYSVTVRPADSTRYYFSSGSAASPTTTVTVDG